MVQVMTRRRFALTKTFSYFRLLSLMCLFATGEALAEPSPAAAAAFNLYASEVESRLDRQHHCRATEAFLAGDASTPQVQARLRQGELIVEQLTPAQPPTMPGAMLHHWRGTAFAPGATAAEFERLLRDFNGYPRYFAPEVLKAAVLTEQGDRMEASMRVRQRHVLTVVMDTAYDVSFARADVRHGYSVSRSTRIAEIDSPGTPKERALTASEEHGFLWRLNTYWTYEERDGGLYLQIESVSLTRSIPTGLGWAVRPFVESVPRESLEFTLRAVARALRSHH
jgi:hypothetical protein